MIVTVGTHKLLGGDFVKSKQTRKKQDVWLMEGRYVKMAGVGAHWGEPSVKPNCDGVEAPRQDTGSPGVGYAKLQQCLCPKGRFCRIRIRARPFEEAARFVGAS